MDTDIRVELINHKFISTLVKDKTKSNGKI